MRVVRVYINYSGCSPPHFCYCFVVFFPFFSPNPSPAVSRIPVVGANPPPGVTSPDPITSPGPSIGCGLAPFDVAATALEGTPLEPPDGAKRTSAANGCFALPSVQQMGLSLERDRCLQGGPGTGHDKRSRSFIAR